MWPVRLCIRKLFRSTVFFVFCWIWEFGNLGIWEFGNLGMLASCQFWVVWRRFGEWLWRGVFIGFCQFRMVSCQFRGIWGRSGIWFWRCGWKWTLPR
ncbi:hypothetical protein BCR34DRAFT_290952 [Clohesyomyces aquaticus]|uniref:Uncharacterized protein n=1 Tax=Clohesyomyces aquaticus TaxID=1231657 RepID=A0A1Y1ZQV7_9PLEO|nr:hypothetical protein BCR34DRAFT_290952 [Clohesyomyces aquaticus]